MNRADQIKRLHGEIEGALRTSLPKAIRIGELLAAQKAELIHGVWQSWLAANLPFCIRTARNYMRLYDNREELKTANVAGLAVAYRKLLGPPAPRPKKKGKGKADDPPSGRQVKLQFTEAEAKEYERLVKTLMEKVFHTSETKSTILAALRYANEQRENIDAKQYTSNNGSTGPVGSGTKGQVPGHKPLFRATRSSAN